MVNKCLTKGTPLFMGVKSQKVTFLASFGAIVSFETSENLLSWIEWAQTGVCVYGH